MMNKPVTTKAPAEQVVKDNGRATRKLHSSKEKIRIVLSGLRVEDSIAEQCRKEGIGRSPYSSWSKEFLEALIFAKLKTLFRKVDERTVDASWRRFGNLLDDFTAAECLNDLRHAAYA